MTNPRSDGFPARVLVTALVFAWAMAIGLSAAGGGPSTAPASPAKATAATRSAPPQATPNTPTGQSAGFAGDETCTTCHETQGKQLHQTLHGKAQNERTPAAKNGRTCETC